jgi:hypothetical protein
MQLETEILFGVLAGDKIQNPKRPIRNKPEIQNENVQDGRRMRFRIWVIRALNLFRISLFGFRISRPSLA